MPYRPSLQSSMHNAPLVPTQSSLPPYHPSSTQRMQKSSYKRGAVRDHNHRKLVQLRTSDPRRSDAMVHIMSPAVIERYLQACFKDTEPTKSTKNYTQAWNEEFEGSRTTTRMLCSTPRSPHDLWRKYDHGITVGGGDDEQHGTSTRKKNKMWTMNTTDDVTGGFSFQDS